MLSRRLEENKLRLQSLEERIAEFKNSIGPQDLVAEDAPEFHNQTLYQLDQRRNETAHAIEGLQSLWIVKNLIHEIKVSFDPLSEGSYECDCSELNGILQNLKLLKSKISPFIREGYIVGSELQESFDNLLHKYEAQLVALFNRHIKQDGSIFTIFTVVTVNQQQHSLREFTDLVAASEDFTGKSTITDSLNSLKPAWDKRLLDPLVNKKKYLRMLVPETADEFSIDLIESHSSSHFLSDEYFASISSFVKFVNLLESQSFKNYFSSKISNSIVNIVSENIEHFVKNRGLLSEKLVQTIQLAKNTGWNLQVAKSLGSIDGIDSSIDALHLEWVTDKHINNVRNYFESSRFQIDLKTTKTIEVPVLIQPVEPMEPAPVPEATKPADSASDTHSEVDWNQPWDSDEEQAEQENDEWDHDWNDEWDSDDHKSAPSSPIKPKSQAKFQPQPPQPRQPQPVQQASIEHITCSGAVDSIKQLIQDFTTEAGQGSLDDLLFAVCEFALASYPSLHGSFLLYNDLNALEYDETTRFAETQWKHSRIQLSGQVSAILNSIDFTNNDSLSEATEETAGITGAIEQFNSLLTSLVESDLLTSNKGLLRATLIDISNHANTWVIDGMLASREITEFQSEKFTRVLEALEGIESQVLAHVDSESNRLATYNRSKQAVLLLNNHLNEIMEHFYQGDLFDFSTDELLRVLQSVFIASDLRESCIQEILEVRTS